MTLTAAPILLLLFLLSRASRAFTPRPPPFVPRPQPRPGVPSVTLPPQPPPPIRPPPEVVVAPLPPEPIFTIMPAPPRPPPPFLGPPPFAPPFPLQPIAPPFVPQPISNRPPRPRPPFRPPPMDNIQPPEPVVIVEPEPLPSPEPPPVPVEVLPVEPPPPPEAPSNQVVVVRRGEGLSQVAQRLGRPGGIEDVRALRKINIPHGPDADWSATSTGNLQKAGRKGGLQPGDVLFVPPGWVT